MKKNVTLPIAKLNEDKIYFVRKAESLKNKNLQEIMLESFVNNVNNMNEEELEIIERAVTKKRKIIDIDKMLIFVISEIKGKGYVVLTKKMEFDTEGSSYKIGELSCVQVKLKVCIEAPYRDAVEDPVPHFTKVATKMDQYDWVKKLGYEYEGDECDLKWEVTELDEDGGEGFGECLLYMYTKKCKFDSIKDTCSMIGGIFNSRYCMWYVNEDGIFEISQSTLSSYNVKNKICDFNVNEWDKFCGIRSIISIYDVADNDDIELDWSEAC